MGFEPTSAAVPDNGSRWIVNPDPAAPSQLLFTLGGFRYPMSSYGSLMPRSGFFFMKIDA